MSQQRKNKDTYIELHVLCNLLTLPTYDAYYVDELGVHAHRIFPLSVDRHYVMNKPFKLFVFVIKNKNHSFGRIG
jgi:hypothetical protein